MLGLLVVAYKIPYSSCIVNTVDVVACHIYSWFLPMSWVLDLSILLSIFVCVYICSADYVGLPAPLYLLRCLVYHMLSKMRRSSGIYM